MQDVERAKRVAAERAVEAVSDGDLVGLGTGSTAAYAIDALGDAVDAGLDIRGVPTSYQSRIRARDVGIELVSLQDIDSVDLAIDGADQIAGLTAIKGGGGAHVRERIVDAAADRLLLVVDERKLAPVLSDPIPVEVLPAAATTVRSRIRSIGGVPTIRAADRKDGPVISEHGNLIFDCDFGRIDSPRDLGMSIRSIPGVLDHGLFVELADAVYVGTDAGVEVKTD